MTPTPPLVRIGTENDTEPPLIIERPDTYPFEPGEREDWRIATDEEFRRYSDHYSDSEYVSEQRTRIEEGVAAVGVKVGDSVVVDSLLDETRHLNGQTVKISEIITEENDEWDWESLPAYIAEGSGFAFLPEEFKEGRR